MTAQLWNVFLLVKTFVSYFQWAYAGEVRSILSLHWTHREFGMLSSCWTSLSCDTVSSYTRVWLLCTIILEQSVTYTTVGLRTFGEWGIHKLNPRSVLIQVRKVVAFSFVCSYERCIAQVPVQATWELSPNSDPLSCLNIGRMNPGCC